ncbi:MAG: response regulator transcription factor [Bdellovibrionales bacterium]|nr:response regulator transcription factor [Bdellovibrionales bacterium]
MKTILCIEDHEDYQFLIPRVLKEFKVLIAGDLASGRQLLSKEKIDLIILDVSLPDGDGLKFFSMLKADDETKNIPTIILSSASDVPNKVLAYNLGVMDYITKPVDPTELKARVLAHLRRSEEASPTTNQLRHEDLVINLDEQRIYIDIDGTLNHVEVTPKEYRLLKLLCQSYDMVLSRDTLLDKVWGSGVNVVDRTIDAHISNLRKKISHCHLSIESVPNEGYRICKRPAVA